MTYDSKLRFRYINRIASSHWYIHKILDLLQSEDYLSSSKDQAL